MEEGALVWTGFLLQIVAMFLMHMLFAPKTLAEELREELEEWEDDISGGSGEGSDDTIDMDVEEDEESLSNSQ